MKKKEQTTWTSMLGDLRNAALIPKQRPSLLAHALQQIIASGSVLGTALIWPCKERKVPWKVYYAGEKRDEMYAWLSARLDPSLDVMRERFQQDALGRYLDMPYPHLLPLRPSSTAGAGLWLVWSLPSPSISPSHLLTEHLEQARLTFEAVLEIESNEDHYFSPSSPLSDQTLIADLGRGNHHALSAFLSLTRIATGADFAFWAQAYQDVVEITSHLGAKHSDFGFTLRRGTGVGGRVAAYGTMVIGDYLHSPYRDASVCELIDNELIRSGIALPVRYSTMSDNHAHVAAVLYATRRTASRFSLAECLLIQRLARLLEPLPLVHRPTSFVLSALPPRSSPKATWYDMILHANKVEEAETWISQFIKGTAILTDSTGLPYVFAHSETVEQIQATAEKGLTEVQQLSLAAPGVNSPGSIYLLPSIALPPPQWPDFFADLVMACNLVIARMERTTNQLNGQREQWLHALLQGQVSKHSEHEGYRLGLPVEHGQVRVLAWQTGTLQATQAARKRMLAENVVLETLKSPLLFLEDETAVVLLDKQAPATPTQVRNALLKHGGAQPLWIVQGEQYHSLAELRQALVHALSLARRARRENYDRYLLDTSMFGLDSLLENPALAKELNVFATRLLAPLLEYDQANSAHLTETLVLAHTLGSAQAVADQLAVHVNTIRYRLHRAEEILGRDQVSPKEQTATMLAAFIWEHFHPLEQTQFQKIGEKE